VSGGAFVAFVVFVAFVAFVVVVLINPKNKLSLLLLLLLLYRGCVKNGFSRAVGGGCMSRRFKNGFLVMVAVALLIIAHHHFNSVLRINHYGLGDSGKTA